jgi:hypothetical protein
MSCANERELVLNYQAISIFSWGFKQLYLCFNLSSMDFSNHILTPILNFSLGA